MPEQPQWSERTLDMPPQDPWADPPTANVPPRPASGPPAQPAPPAPAPSPFSSGRAAVNPRPRTQQFAAEHEPTGTGWPGEGRPEERRPLGWHLRQLRRGGEWSFAGLLFAFVCWGIWAISSDGKLTAPVVVFIVSLLVAAGLFALSRLVGRLVLERQFGRVRRTARGAHIMAGIFLVGVGVAHLRQTEWVMTAFNWTVELFR
ncbi:DNA-directed RNA polymerase II [Actinoplanes sp. NPDC049599]|uniref:DNA-directed RNA polymerase II n=1 Tax=Actinoplanes sp. NPDC049599 TaxID=3363903 RepID=UPI0037A526E7